MAIGIKLKYVFSLILMPLLLGFYFSNRSISIKEHIHKDIKVVLSVVVKRLEKICMSIIREIVGLFAEHLYYGLTIQLLKNELEVYIY